MATATAIYTGSSAPGPAATGHSTQGHVQVADQMGAIWFFYLTGTQTISAKYSYDGVAWNTPITIGPGAVVSGFTLAKPHNSEGRNFAFWAETVNNVDVLHMASSYAAVPNGWTYHSRYTLGTTWTCTNAEAQVGTTISSLVAGQTVDGPVVCLDSNFVPIHVSGFAAYSTNYGALLANYGSYPDMGATWAAGFGATTLLSAPANAITNRYIVPLLASGQTMVVSDNASSSALTNGSGTETNLLSSKYAGSWGTIVTAAASNYTQIDSGQWGATRTNDGVINALALTSGGNTFSRYQYISGSWSTHSTPGNLALVANSGVGGASDGVSVYWFAVSGSAIYYGQAGGKTVGWTSLVSGRSNTPTFVTACYNPFTNSVHFFWTETNAGPTYEVWSSLIPSTVNHATFAATGVYLGVGKQASLFYFSDLTLMVPSITCVVDR